MDPSGTHPGDAVVACAPPERYGLVMAGAPSLLVETWVSGWARARGTPPPERHRDGFRVEVGAPDQRPRYVFPAVSATLPRLADEIGRASCRDTAVSYVLLLFVVLSLQNNLFFYFT